MLAALKDLEIKISDDWASKRDGHRAFLRQALRDSEVPQSAWTRPDILDLTIIPETKDGAVSISHCQAVGGWAFDQQSTRIGFDLEVIARARPELVARQPTAAEFAEAPSAAALWTAKEAAYKCLPLALQPLTAREIRIANWVEVDGGYEFNAIFGELKLHGWTWAIREGVIASLCR